MKSAREQRIAGREVTSSSRRSSKYRQATRPGQAATKIPWPSFCTSFGSCFLNILNEFGDCAGSLVAGLEIF